MRKLILAQIFSMIIVCIFMVFLGFEALFSAFLGGISYLVPTVVSLGIFLVTGKNAVIGTIAFFYAQMCKLLLAVLLMVCSFMFYTSLQWIPFFLGLLATVYSVFFTIEK
ncbi:MAG: ATP synthase subunit I [Neisseriaceae bacterium]|nr:ATP synthase subunit I [Neisseriaceae bacterium]